MIRRRISRICLLLALAWIGCAPKLEPREERGERDAGVERSDAGTLEEDGRFTHRVHASGAVVTVTDATDSETWQYLDLDSRRADDAAERWDLGFSRFRVRTNGGASGPADVRVAALDGADFDALVRAPDEGFGRDRPDSDEDTDSDPDNVFNSGAEDWYAYDVMTHTLAPRDVTYVVASTAARFYKVRFETYYDDAGTPGLLTFRWAEIEAPDGGLSNGDQDEDGGTPLTD